MGICFVLTYCNRKMHVSEDYKRISRSDIFYIVLLLFLCSIVQSNPEIPLNGYAYSLCKMQVGIDDLAIYVPKLYVDYKDFAEARGIAPQKLERGIGIKKMALVDTNQDPACMAANACLKLMQRNHLQPKDIGRMYVATESALDESKAMNSFVIGMLEQVYGEGSFEHAGGIECKFACVSGSYALYDNTNWIRAEENNGKAAVVIVSDIA